MKTENSIVKERAKFAYELLKCNPDLNGKKLSEIMNVVDLYMFIRNLGPTISNWEIKSFASSTPIFKGTQNWIKFWLHYRNFERRFEKKRKSFYYQEWKKDFPDDPLYQARIDFKKKVQKGYNLLRGNFFYSTEKWDDMLGSSLEHRIDTENDQLIKRIMTEQKYNERLEFWKTKTEELDSDLKKYYYSGIRGLFRMLYHTITKKTFNIN